VKVLDFGIAKLLEGNRARPMTDDGIMLGTPAYMAPEQATASPVDARTDLFAVGICLYQMLTGGNPFLTRGRMETLERVLSHEPPRVDRLRSEVPTHVADAVARALAKAPAERPSSAAELAAALGGPVVGGGLTMAPANAGGPATLPPGPVAKRPAAPLGDRSPRRTGRVFATSVVASVVVIGAFGAAVGYAFRLGRASRPEAPAPAPATTTRDAEHDAGGARDAVDAAAAPVPAPEAEAPPPTAAPTRATAAARAGTCACLPLRGDSVQGDNMRLAPVPDMPQTALCSLKGALLEILCPRPRMLDSDCRPYRFTTTRASSPCTGFEPETETVAKGVSLHSTWVGATDVYAGPPGSPCRGWRVDGKASAGRVVCFGK